MNIYKEKLKERQSIKKEIDELYIENDGADARFTEIAREEEENKEAISQAMYNKYVLLFGSKKRVKKLEQELADKQAQKETLNAIQNANRTKLTEKTKELEIVNRWLSEYEALSKGDLTSAKVLLWKREFGLNEALSFCERARNAALCVFESLDNGGFENDYISIIMGGRVGGSGSKNFDNLQKALRSLHMEFEQFDRADLQEELYDALSQNMQNVFFFLDMYLSERLNSMSVLEETKTIIENLDELKKEIEGAIEENMTLD